MKKINNNLIFVLLLVFLSSAVCYCGSSSATESVSHDKHNHEKEENENVDKDLIFLSNKRLALSTILWEDASIKKVKTMLHSTGEITYNENKIAKLSSSYPGVVADLNVQLGSNVKKGSHLLSLKNNELAQLLIEYEKINKTIDNERKHKTILSQSLTKKYQASKNALDNYQANIYEPLKNTYNKDINELDKYIAMKKDLAKDKIISKTDYLSEKKEISDKKREYNSTVSEADSRLLEKELSVRQDEASVNIEIANSEKNIKQSENELHILADRLELFGIRENELSSFLNHNSHSEFYKFYSPIAGEVVEKKVALGEQIEPNSNIITVANMDELWVWCKFLESDIQFINIGKSVEVKIIGLNDIFEATIDYVSPVLEPNSRTIQVRVTIPNKSRKIMIGAIANVSLITDIKEGLAVPISAIEGDVDSPYVYIASVFKDKHEHSEKEATEAKDDIKDKHTEHSEKESDSDHTEKHNEDKNSSEEKDHAESNEHEDHKEEKNKEESEGYVFEQRPVKILSKDNQYVLISEGLKENELVVTKGIGVLKVESGKSVLPDSCH